MTDDKDLWLMCKCGEYFEAEKLGEHREFCIGDIMQVLEKGEIKT
jgi:hypothetical protein